MTTAPAKALFEWREEYNTGIREIDEQHKRLAHLVNDLHQAMHDGKGKEALGSILDQLIDYTKTHFRAEEAMMTRCGYAGLAAHRHQHELLTGQALTLQKGFSAGTLTITMQTMTFLKDWLRSHILREDMKYVPFLKTTR